ncbi:MAG TPA: hypothetical protein VKT77_17760 [Chthonomonadaceae bacterium]|nr:hypothetical protein [Chthonomonadaceae bacterium]
MTKFLMTEALERVAVAHGSLAGQIEVRRDGSRLALFTGPAAVNRSRVYTRAVGVIAAAGGIFLLHYSGWFLPLIAFGVAVALFAGKLVNARRLVEIDTAVRSHAEGSQRGPGLDVEQVRAVRGVYDTKGWDGFTTVSAEQDDGMDVPLVILMGTDEQLAECLCRTPGLLFDCPSTCAGPFGSSKSCYTPARV